MLFWFMQVCDNLEITMHWSECSSDPRILCQLSMLSLEYAKRVMCR
jgi:hypothetical protein